MANKLDSYANTYESPMPRLTGTPKDKVDAIPQDEKLPVKALPMTTREKPFKVTGGGNGG